MKIEGSGSASESDPLVRGMAWMHGSADPDPDPHQNVMDPEQDNLKTMLHQFSFYSVYGSSTLHSKYSYIFRQGIPPML
jgi:hypothetical protein